ncbi:hypothetical protein ACOME3_003964 [Neoechinorhynchus agilis]
MTRRKEIDLLIVNISSVLSEFFRLFKCLIRTVRPIQVLERSFLQHFYHYYPRIICTFCDSNFKSKKYAYYLIFPPIIEILIKKGVLEDQNTRERAELISDFKISAKGDISVKLKRLKIMIAILMDRISSLKYADSFENVIIEFRRNVWPVSFKGISI